MTEARLPIPPAVPYESLMMALQSAKDIYPDIRFQRVQGCLVAESDRTKDEMESIMDTVIFATAEEMADGYY